MLYYPLDSWFIRTTALRDKMIELNKTIRWKPNRPARAASANGSKGWWTGTFRARASGNPLPVWATEDYSEVKCIGSVEELMAEIEKSIAAV